MKLSARLHKCPSQLPASTLHRLNMYATAAGAAGVSVLALGSAEAKIVYTPADVKLQGTANYHIDLNHDGVSDFLIAQFATVTASETVTLLNLDVSSNRPNQWIKVKRPHGFFPANLKAGEEVGPRQYSNGQFSGGPHNYMANLGWYKNEGHPRLWGAWANDGKGTTDRYLGLRFQINGEYHYGWVRASFKVAQDASVTTITGYAYETVAGKKIATGDTGGELATNSKSATLGQLAAGRR
jgi:hypothetical protein